MASNQATGIVLFDLDKTLFDHYHSNRCAISAVQEQYTGLAGWHLTDLIRNYNSCVIQANDQFVLKEVSYEEAGLRKIRLFFQSVGFPRPDLEEIEKFRSIYKHAYRANRRASPGAIEALTKLREHGYRIAIVTNRQIDDQIEKAEAIGIIHLVHHIITSEEARRNFEVAIAAVGGGGSITMVGDSVHEDIQGALGAGFNAIIYSPGTDETVQVVYGKEVPVIHHMDQLFDQLDILGPGRTNDETGSLHLCLGEMAL